MGAGEARIAAFMAENCWHYDAKLIKRVLSLPVCKPISKGGQLLTLCALAAGHPPANGWTAALASFPCSITKNQLNSGWFCDCDLS